MATRDDDADVRRARCASDGDQYPDLDDLLRGIFQNINADLAEHPEIVPLAIVPVVRDGNTVAMCMGYGRDGPDFPSRG